MTKSILVFCGKSALFTIIFWFLWSWGLKPIFSEVDRASSKEGAQAAAQMAAYEEQVARANRQMDISEALQKRMDNNLAAQEEASKRFDAVLSVWEKNAGLKN